MTVRAVRRWELTDAERERIAERARRPFSPRELISLALRRPRLTVELLSALRRGLKRAVGDDPALVWALDTARLRQIVPDAAAGVAWVDEELFVDPLLGRLDPGMRVLDLGCGGGRITRHVAPRVAEVICADVSTAFLDEARENLASFSNIRFARTEQVRLSTVDSASVDLAYAQGVVSYTPPQLLLPLLLELHRVLVVGGTLFFNTFAVDDPAAADHAVSLARQAVERGRYRASDPIPYSANQIEALLLLAGFECVERTIAGPPVPAIFVGRNLSQG